MVPYLIVACLLVIYNWIDSFLCQLFGRARSISPKLSVLRRRNLTLHFCFLFPIIHLVCASWARSPVCNSSSWCITAKNAFIMCMQSNEKTKECSTRERIKTIIWNALFLSRIELGFMESRLRRTIFSCMFPYATLIFSSHYHVLSVVPGFIMPQMITVFLTRLWMGSYFMDVCVPK
jgi:hypothetical protein